MNRSFAVSTVMTIMSTLQDSAQEAYIDEDYEEAHIIMSDMRDLAQKLTNTYGPEWFTEDEIDFLENLLIYNL